LPVELGALCRNLFDERIIYQKGCYNGLNNRVKTRLTIIMYVALAFGLFQVIKMFLVPTIIYRKIENNIRS